MTTIPTGQHHAQVTMYIYDSARTVLAFPVSGLFTGPPVSVEMTQRPGLQPQKILVLSNKIKGC